MTYLTKPKLHHPALPTNVLGLTRRDYEGAVSTLCAGCGHDSISAAIIQAFFELAIPPHRVAKLSGIGCSSKTPTYFLSAGHGFNSVHGRMPSVVTGAALANRDLIYLGVSGDGDSASIGLGQFAHIMRRGVNMTYIVENNGVYGLTKGQFSATADKGSKAKKGAVNSDEPIDLYEIVRQRYERGSTIFTSNRAIEEWPPLFGDLLLASAALDRLLHHAHVIEMDGDTFRNPPANKRAKAGTPRPT
jgi:2-oxoglutarate ferredoxin oxidoreductase subunit beta